jgi:hypothetical protein
MRKGIPVKSRMNLTIGLHIRVENVYLFSFWILSSASKFGAGVYLKQGKSKMVALDQ